MTEDELIALIRKAVREELESNGVVSQRFCNERSTGIRRLVHWLILMQAAIAVEVLVFLLTAAGGG
ncbi:MAG: hypothetical protein ACXQT3_00335 [Methermicoccaceae archaeon]